MVLALAAVVGVLVGLALGGSLGRLADLRLRSTWLFGFAFGLQVLAYPSGVLPWRTSDAVATGLWLGSYGLLIVAASRNLRVRGFGIAVAGMVSNLVAVLANGGHMPATRAAMRAAGVRFHGVHANSIAARSPHLPWLVDRFGAPGWVPLAGVYSVGDVLLAVGVVVIVAAAMGPRLPRALLRVASG
jgi:hypothetical protein